MQNVNLVRQTVREKLHLKMWKQENKAFLKLKYILHPPVNTTSYSTPPNSLGIKILAQVSKLGIHQTCILCQYIQE